LSAEGVVDGYLTTLAAALAEVSRAELAEVAMTLISARDAGRRVYIFGNGGSAATAAHMANDLNKLCSVGRRRFRAVCLNDNAPTMLAWANDQDFADILAEQLDNHVEPGDVVLLISTSGMSANVLRGARLARRRGAKVVGVVGSDGGELGSLADVRVRAPSGDVGQQEDMHLVFNHALAAAIRALTPEE
jgi:D-sedoheptulose 7-phosphate isomerase